MPNASPPPAPRLAAAALRYRQSEHHDAQDHAAQLNGWDQHYEQLAAGAFHGSLEDLGLDTVHVFREQTQRVVFQHGRTRHDTLTLALPLHCPGEGRFCGAGFDGGAVFVVGPGQDFELITPDRLDLLAVSVDIASLHREAETAGQPLTLPRTGAQAIPTPPTATRALRELLLTALDCAQRAPDALPHEELQWQIQQAVCSVLHHDPGQQVDARALATARARRRLVGAARAWLLQRVHEPVDVPALCKALQVSRRTLQYSFEDVLGMPPASYLRAMRLNGVRNDLRLAAVPSVADAAARWGFWHLPRFAGDYRALFGELPSRTLRGAVLTRHQRT